MKNAPIFRFSLMLLFAIIGVLVIGFMRPEPISSPIQKDKFWATKVHAKEKYNVIIMGDSRVYRGIDPRSMSESLDGLKVLNFGFSSGGHNPLIFKEVEKRLDHSTKRKAIVMALTPYSLTDKAQENGHFIQEKERDNNDILMRRYVKPALNFFDPIKPTDIIYAKDTIKGYHEKFRRDGWVESKKIPFNNKAALKVYVKDFKGNRINPRVVEQILSQIKKWTSQGISVFAFRMPTTRAMESLENNLSGYVEEDLKAAFEKAGGHWLTYENKYGYQSYDGSHLDGEAAKEFSLVLGTELSKYLK